VPKNILVFSDGTGQAGGYMPDEARSNVYKLFRATRVGPDTSIDPKQQIAFYDGGLGSRAHGESIRLKAGRRIYNFLGKATGLGITRNIIDCYAEIIRVWQPGDRIYLFGFSRGAYTVRCVAGVLKHCGVPTAVRRPSGRVVPLKRDPHSARAIATEAVKRVYQYGSSIKGDPLRKERAERAAEFRRTYFSGDEQASNTAPYFIGVWDTVRTLGAGARWLAVATCLYFLLGIPASVLLAGLAAMVLDGENFPAVFLATYLLLTIGLPVSIYIGASIRYRGLLSLARYRMAFYDTQLAYAVRYARQALAIDENRRQFDCVPWGEDNTRPRAAGDASVPARFRQMWFAGSHSDVGGSYPETESRLSDIALAWMVEEAMSLPEPILVDASVLKLYPDWAGMQHDERKAAISVAPTWLTRLAFRLGLQNVYGWRLGHRRIPVDAELHPSVLTRFKLPAVLVHDHMVPYRPHALRRHWAVRGYWPPPAGSRPDARAGLPPPVPSRRPTPRLAARSPVPAAPGRRWWKARYR
jgi:uncharacterized protein (DUF2235 family)